MIKSIFLLLVMISPFVRGEILNLSCKMSGSEVVNKKLNLLSTTTFFVKLDMSDSSLSVNVDKNDGSPFISLSSLEKNTINETTNDVIKISENYNFIGDIGNESLEINRKNGVSSFRKTLSGKNIETITYLNGICSKSNKNIF